MKNILLFIMMMTCFSSYAQGEFYGQISIKHATPLDGFGETDKNFDIQTYSGSIETINESKLFNFLADPTYGWSVSASYLNNNLNSGIEVGFARYKQTTPGYKLHTVHVTTYMDYLWLDNSLKIITGLEAGIYSTKALINRDIVVAENLALSRFGITTRLGLNYYIPNSRFGINVLSRLILNRQSPSYEFSTGVFFGLSNER